MVDVGGGSYEGRLDGQQAPLSTYMIWQWSPKGVKFSGVPASPQANMRLVAVFTGKVAPDRLSLQDTKVDVTINSIPAGSIPFTMTWDASAIRHLKDAPNGAVETPASRPSPAGDLTKHRAIVGYPDVDLARTNLGALWKEGRDTPIASIIDVEMPDPKLDRTPPPTPAFQPFTSGVTHINLTGAWESDRMVFGEVEHLAIFQLRDHFLAKNNGESHIYARDAIEIDMKFESGQTISGDTLNPIYPLDTIERRPATGTIKDVDHFVLSSGASFHRLSSAPVSDIPCVPSAKSEVSALDAYNRGEAYDLIGDPTTAHCWYYVAMSKGHLDAEAKYAVVLFTGQGAAVDKVQATAWLQDAAMRGSWFGGVFLRNLFDVEGGLPRSVQRAHYWNTRTRAFNILLRHDPTLKLNVPEPWMEEVSEPCGPSSRTRVSGDEALVKGRVAYEAHSLQTAHCWFRISALQGNMIATTYLGLMSEYGIGIKQNRENGVIYMAKAADAGYVFARVFLAEFFRFNIGVSGGMFVAKIQMKEAYKDPSGESAMNEVEIGLDAPSTTGIGSTSYSPDYNCITAANRTHSDNSSCYSRVAENAANENQDRVAKVLSDRQEYTTLSKPEELYPEFRHWF